MSTAVQQADWQRTPACRKLMLFHFRVLEVLLHKGPLPVNAIGPKVDLNAGSVSVAVDRLHKKGFVSRVESVSDRRVRTVSMTERGREMFIPLFRRHPRSHQARLPGRLF